MQSDVAGYYAHINHSILYRQMERHLPHENISCGSSGFR